MAGPAASTRAGTRRSPSTSPICSTRDRSNRWSCARSTIRGIWQTVWIERVPATWLRSLRWTPNLERWEIGLEATFAGQARDRLRLCVRLRVGDTLIADGTYAVVAGSVHRRIALSDPGID